MPPLLSRKYGPGRYIIGWDPNHTSGQAKFPAAQMDKWDLADRSLAPRFHAMRCGKPAIALAVSR
jgi:hypothetical protein